jgi:hypothetical protein
MSRQTAIYAFIGALITPFLIWALLATTARRNPRLLESIYPGVKVLTWGMYAGMLLCIMFSTFSIGNSIDRKTVAYVWAIGFPFYGGINLMRGWIRRRVEPEAEPKPSEGWWPTPKDY